MAVKIVVRDGEAVERAIDRFRKNVICSRVGEKWPYLRTFYAPPSMVRHRAEWLKKMRRRYALEALRRNPLFASNPKR